MPFANSYKGKKKRKTNEFIIRLQFIIVLRVANGPLSPIRFFVTDSIA